MSKTSIYSLAGLAAENSGSKVHITVAHGQMRTKQVSWSLDFRIHINDLVLTMTKSKLTSYLQ